MPSMCRVSVVLSFSVLGLVKRVMTGLRNTSACLAMTDLCPFGRT